MGQCELDKTQYELEKKNEVLGTERSLALGDSMWHAGGVCGWKIAELVSRLLRVSLP